MKKILCILSLAILASCNGGASSTVVTPQNIGSGELNELNQEEGEMSNEDSQVGQESLGDMLAMIEKLPNIYMQDENFQYCVVQNTNACISDFKFQNPDTTSCDDFLTENSIEMCKITEITAKARQEESTLLCDTLESGVDGCKNEVTIAMGMKSGNVASCDILGEEFKNQCKNQIITFNAMNARDEALCDSLIIPEESLSYEIDFCKQEVEMQLENDRFEKQQQELQEKMQAEQEAQ